MEGGGKTVYLENEEIQKGNRKRMTRRRIWWMEKLKQLSMSREREKVKNEEILDFKRERSGETY